VSTADGAIGVCPETAERARLVDDVGQPAQAGDELVVVDAQLVEPVPAGPFG